MRCARALPTLQLMPAAGSRIVLPPPPALLGGRPGKNERPHPFTSPHAGHPIHHHVAGPPCPWTQIRLGAGTLNGTNVLSHGRQHMP
jgi:hypothetical protein